MWPRMLPLVAALAIAGCATAQTDDRAGAKEIPGTSPAGRTTVAAVGTPFYVAMKVPVCVGTVAMAAPLAGLFALTDPPNREGRRALDHGVSRNCGPPYVLAP